MPTIADHENRLKELVDQQSALEAEVVAVVNGQSDEDLFRLSKRRNDLSVQISSAKAKLIRAEIANLRQQQDQSKMDHASLDEPVREAATVTNDLIEKANEAGSIHLQLQAKQVFLEERYKLFHAQIVEKQRELESLVEKVIGSPE